VAQLALRLVLGGQLTGHEAQKLFGRLAGSGLDGTSGWLAPIGYRPAKPWAAPAGLSELGGEALAALGLVHPLVPVATCVALDIATLDVRAGHPIWAAEGGAELPITNIAAAMAVSLTSSGAFPLDHALGIHVPKSVVSLAVLGVAAGEVVAERLPGPAPRAQRLEEG